MIVKFETSPKMCVEVPRLIANEHLIKKLVYFANNGLKQIINVKDGPIINIAAY